MLIRPAENLSQKYIQEPPSEPFAPTVLARIAVEYRALPNSNDLALARLAANLSGPVLIRQDIWVEEKND